jgi:hypothetical protein
MPTKKLNSYTVLGLYADNQQPWTTHVSAKDPTAAAIKGIKEMEKSYDADINDLFVVEVVAGKVEGLLGNDSCMNIEKLKERAA